MTQPYFSLFSTVVRAYIGNISDPALRVFMTLATYIDPFGWCYPGVATIATLTGYSANRVQDCLNELETAGWLYYCRRQARDPLTGHWLPNVYGLNPQLVAVRPPILGLRENEESADSSVLTQTENPPILGVREEKTHNQHQIKHQESITIDPESVNQHQQPNFALNGTIPLLQIVQRPSSSTDPTDPDKPSSSTKPDKPRPPAPHGAKPLTPQPPAPTLAEFATPLPDGEAESLVDLVCATVGNMTTPNARRLVSNYGMKQVRAALNVLGAQPEIANPGGFLRFLLEKYAVDPDRDAGMKAKEDDRHHSRDLQDFILR